MPFVNGMQNMEIHQWEIEIQGRQFVLRSDATALDVERQTLLATDLHLGKDASFRAAGMPVPEGMVQSILGELSVAIEATEARRLIILGDLIHNRASLRNELNERFQQWRSEISQVEVVLVKGNHDRHIAQTPAKWGVDIVTSLQEDGVSYIHETSDSAIACGFQVGGHLHPVVQLGDKVNRMRMRCFVLDEHRLVLPAFGIFKGGAAIKPKKNRQLFAIGDHKIWKCEC